MGIGRKHELLEEFSRNFDLSVLAHGSVSERVRQSLRAHDKLAQRKSPLRPTFVFWLVIGMVLMRDRSIPAVFAALIEAGRALFPHLSRRAVGDGALAHARERLGSDVFATFFRATVADMPTDTWFHGLRPRAIDGVHLTLPDTPKNRDRFPLQKTGRGRSAWPHLHAVCLVDLQTRRIADAALGSSHDDERSLARTLYQDLTPSDLVVEDRGFFCAQDFVELDRAGKKFLCRMSEKVKPRLVAVLGPGDRLVELRFRRPLAPAEESPARCGRPGKTLHVRVIVRLIEYRLKGCKGRYRLATNVLDSAIRPKEFAALYHWRWDAEITFDELKTHLLAVHHGKQHTLFRSKSPTLVEQEFWALLAGYNLVRDLMCRAAKRVAMLPTALSFTDSLRAIEGTLQRAQSATDSQRPRLFEQLMTDLAECRLDRVRRPRKWPRVVKAKMSIFGVKKKRHREKALAIEVCLPTRRRKTA